MLFGRRSLYSMGRRQSIPPFVVIVAVVAMLVLAVVWINGSKTTLPSESQPGVDIKSTVSQLTAKLKKQDPVRRELLSAPENALLSPIAVSFPLKVPISGRVTSGYGYRLHPTTSMLDFHTGIDISSPEGTPISSAMVGVVQEVGESPIYGKYIVVQHGENLVTRYCHCSAIVATVGQRVREGEIVAKVGSTGVATGAHLHFEVHVDRKIADPMWVLANEH